ncbi:DUF4352 domain-containing protein [Halococcoides cellulosivorans]|nr:DUF4352 domain-containing protein [Halococcoides cellulosivorans]
MHRSRRGLLQACGATLMAIAGCSSPESDSEGVTSTPEDSDSAGESGAPEEAIDLEFGEGAEFTNDGDVKLQVILSNPQLVETAPVVTDSQIYVDSPESKPQFFTVQVFVANEGSATLSPPKGLYFRVDGEEVDRSFVRTSGQTYRDIGDLSPGDSATGTIAFPAPAGPATGTVALRFQTLLESPPARWTFDFADVPQTSTDLSRDGLGASVTVDAGPYAYEFTPLDAHETTAYTDASGTEHTASAGSTFVVVEARSENVGDEPVKLPNPYSVRLAADGSIYRGQRYANAADRYEGRVDPYRPGDDQAGKLLFEVPDAASRYTLRLAIGNDTFVTWPLDVDTS